MGASSPSPATGTYDIYLLVGCTSWPNLGDLSRAGSDYPLLPCRGSWCSSSRNLACLRLDLPFADVTALLVILRSGGAVGQVAPAAFRQPRVSIDDALVLAQPVLVQRATADFAGYQFGPVMLWREDARWWVIETVSEQVLDAIS